MKLIAAAILGAAIVAAPAASAGGGGFGGLCAPVSHSATIEMRDNCFEGAVQFVDAGARITVHNGGQMPHTLTASDGSFDTGVLDPGQTFELTPSATGVLPVYCKLHGTADGTGMAGAIVVGGTASGKVKAAALVASSPAPLSNAGPGVGTAVLVALAALGGSLGTAIYTSARRWLPTR
jgi:plastocyanin